METLEFNNVLAHLLRGLKRDAGVATMRQGYRGTGKQVARRQIFVRFADGAATDLWLEHGWFEFAGVMGGPRIPKLVHGANTPEQSYQAIVTVLNAVYNNKEKAA